MAQSDTIQLIVLLDRIAGESAAGALYLYANTLHPEKFSELVALVKATYPYYAETPSDVGGANLLGQKFERPSAAVAGVYSSAIVAGLATADEVANDIRDSAGILSITLEVLTPVYDLSELPDWAPRPL